MNQDLSILVTTVFNLLLGYALWRFLKPQKDRLLKALVDEAIKRAPPVESKDLEEGVPFEVYRKDLLRMVDGEISIDEFVEIWRGRKVQKRPKVVDQAALEAAMFFKGEWLRVTNPSSPAFRKLVAVEDVRGEEIRVEHLLEVGRSTVISLRMGEFESAVPEVGEWWMLTPPGLPEGNPAIWNEVLSEERKKELRKQVLDLQLQPNNFGVGLPVFWERAKARADQDADHWKVICQDEAFGMVLREWAIHVQAKAEGWLADDGTQFGKLVQTWQKQSSRLGMLIEAFSNLIQPKSWEQALSAMKPYLKLNIAAIFGKNEAGPFYDAFRRVMVHRHSWKFVDPGLPLGKQRCECGEMFEPPKDVQASDIFKTLNSVISEFSKGVADMVDLKKLDVMAPEVPLPAIGKWVRVTRPSSPAVGLLGRVTRKNIDFSKSIIIEVRDVRDESHILQLDEGEFEHPPYPREGEWWSWHVDMREPFPFVWQDKRDPSVSKTSEEEHRREILRNIESGTLYPVNFGRGA